MIHTDQQVPCLDPKNWILAHRSMQSLACKDIAYERDIGFPEQVGVKWDSEKSKKWDEFPKVSLVLDLLLNKDTDTSKLWEYKI